MMNFGRATWRRRAFLSAIALLAVAACSSGGGSSDEPAGPSPDSEVPIPLIGEPIDELTGGMLQQALEAAEDGLGYDFANDRLVSLPVAPSQVLLRPGTQILPESIFPGWCTAAFVFDDRSRIATAGHCTNVGDAVIALAAPSTIFAIGVTSQSTGADSELGDDWALIDILPQWRPFTDPAVAVVGGPCGRASENPAPLLKFVGHGAVIGTGGTPRAGVLLGREGNGFVAAGPSYLGDSGAPVLETTQVSSGPPPCAAGGAFGILTHGEVIDFGLGGVVPTGFFFGTPISRIGNALDDASLLP